ncbi:hypothetical protein EB810_15585 [Altererythrobacter sp. FM1]|nr:hypothetical protein EB810_15585 [Altererythrobacter sp. FM1]
MMRCACIIFVALLMGCSRIAAGNSEDTPDMQSASQSSGSTVAKRAHETDAPTPPAEVQEGRCYMDECSYTQELRREVIGGGLNGKLIKLTLRGGTSASTGSAIQWEKTPHDVYVFCSTILPATMLKADGGWQVDVLDFINGVPGILENSQSIYAETCHKGDGHFPNDAKSLGYQEIPQDKQDVSISSPEDIFALSAK